MSAAAGSGLSLGSLYIEIAARFGDALRELREFSKKTDQFVKDQKEKWETLGNLGDAFIKVGAGLTAGVTAPIVGLGAAAVKTAEDLNTARVAFTTMLGSGEAANKLLSDLQKFAATTPFEFPDLVNAAQRMKALGIETSAIIPTLRTIGDTVAASGKMSKDSIDTIVTAFGKMQNSGKVTTEALNMLTDKGVAAWQILADASGKSVAEVQKAVEKGLVPATEAIPVLLEGMNKKAGGAMEAMSKTLTGQWSNFKDQVTQALIPIGQALIPALQQLMPILTAVMDKVKEGAEWFMGLPQPVQNAAIAFAAIAAAIGPILVGVGGLITAFTTLMPALTAVAGFFGTSVAALGPWALAIAAVTAALVALGTWVYENWEPIVAVLKTAWEGVQEAWAAIWGAITSALTSAWNSYVGVIQTIWGPVIKFFETLWDAVAPYFRQAWNAIAGALTSVWDGIKQTAQKIWGAISDAIQTFLKWAEKIPGVSKLMNLDDVWKSAEKSAQTLNQTADATKKVGDESGKTAAKITLVTDSAKEQKKHLKELNETAQRTSNAWIAAWKRNEDAVKEVNATVKWFVENYAKLEQLNKDLKRSNDDLALNFGKAHEAMRQEALKTVEIIVPAAKRIPEEVQKAIQANKDLEAAYKNLGITSAAELNKQYAEAKKAYDLITASGKASARDIDAAWVAMEKARQDAMIAAGETIPKEHKKMLEKMETDLSASKTKQKDAWGDMTKEVSTIITNFTQDIAKSLFEGDMSWGEKAKSMLKSLGSAVVSSFIQPATAALAGFMNGIIKDLMGGEGFGGLKDKIIDVGETFKKIFGKGGDMETATGGPGGAGGIGAGGAQGIAAGAAGGLTGWISAISGIVTAISSVIQNFQLMKMETTLNAIEHNTRYSMMFLGERGDGGIVTAALMTVERLGYVNATLDGIAGKLDNWLEPAKNAVEAISTQITFAQTRLDEISSNTHWGLAATQDNTRLLAEIRDMMIQEKTTPAAWTVTFAGDPIARLVGDEIMRQLRLQGVNLVPGVGR